MTPRSTKRKIVGFGLVAVLGVTGCTFHPGTAAVVNGTTISQSKVDDLVGAACSFTALNRLKNPAPSGPSSSIAFFKHLFTQDLISFAITDKAARLLHITVSQGAIARIAGQPEFPAGLSSSDKASLEEFFSGTTRARVQQAVIGAHLKDPSVTTADSVTPDDVDTLAQSANPYMARFTRQQSVQVNPSYGSWNGSMVGATDGSLSAPASEVAGKWLRLRKGSAADPSSVAGLPPNQVCG